jgi:hypothetical protein
MEVNHECNSRYDLHKHAKATLGSGNLQAAVKLPETEDRDEWLAVHSKSNNVFPLLFLFVAQIACVNARRITFFVPRRSCASYVPLAVLLYCARVTMLLMLWVLMLVASMVHSFSGFATKKPF